MKIQVNFFSSSGIGTGSINVNYTKVLEDSLFLRDWDGKY